jgi:chromosome segregation ATPase
MYIHKRQNSNFSNYTTDEILGFEKEIKEVVGQIASFKSKLLQMDSRKDYLTASANMIQAKLDYNQSAIYGTNKDFKINNIEQADAVRLEMVNLTAKLAPIKEELSSISKERFNTTSSIDSAQSKLIQLVEKTKQVDAVVNNTSTATNNSANTGGSFGMTKEQYEQYLLEEMRKDPSKAGFPEDNMNKPPVVAPDFFAKIGISKNIALLIGGAVVLFGVYMLKKKSNN